MHLRVAFLLAYVFINDCFAQQYPFVHYTPKDGLVNSRVRKSWQDSRGIMYFMTYGGLSVYDGARFRNYTVQNGLSSDLINDMIEIGEDSIWIACNFGRLNYIRGGRIGTVPIKGFTPIINKFIRSNDGSIYAIADEGLFRFRHDSLEKIPLQYRGNPNAGIFILDLIESGSYFLMVPDKAMNATAAASLFVFDKNTGNISTAEENKHIYAFAKTRRGEILVCSGQGIERIDTVALQTGKLQYMPPPLAYKDLPSVIHYISMDHSENLWIFSINSKLTKIEPDGTRKKYSVLNGMGSNNFSNIFQDREGTFWISLFGPGVDKLVNDNIELHEQVNGSPVNIFFTDEYTDSVIVHALMDEKLTFLENNIPKESFKTTSRFVSITGDSRLGKIYLSDGQNIFRAQYKNGNIHHYKIHTGGTPFAYGNISIDPNGNVVMCGSNQLTAIINDVVIARYPTSQLMDQVAFDKNGRLWVATRNGDLLLLGLQPDDPENYFKLINHFGKEYPRLNARSIVVDRNNNLWVGTRFDGVYGFKIGQDNSIEQLFHYTIKDGLTDNFIIHLTCDRENTVWLSTASGLDRIQNLSHQVQIENVTRSQYVYPHILRTLVSRDGTAWSNSADGNLLKVGKKSILNSTPPELSISELKIGNHQVDSLKFPGSLSHRQNSFFISVAAPSFYNEKQIQYSYWLEGSGNEQWSEPSTYPAFNFINLYPGKYRLKLKAIFPAGRYPDKEILYPFVINPPWWQTTWFRILIALLITALLVVAIRSYYRRKLSIQRTALEKQQAIEKERTRIATDIHDDLGSGLSRIRYLGEMVKLKSTQQQDITPEIEKISSYSDEMVDSMNEIVWALNKKNDTLEALIFYTRSFAVEYLSNKGLSCSVSIPEQVPFYRINGEMRRNIFLSVKESIHNVTKHAAASEVSIRFELNSGLEIIIHDNGQGINWEKIRPFSNGLTNIRRRMEEMNAVVHFNNEKGTKVVFHIPLS